MKVTMRNEFEKWLKSEAKARAGFRLDPAYVWDAAYQAGAIAMRERAAKANCMHCANDRPINPEHGLHEINERDCYPCASTLIRALPVEE